MSAAHQDGRLAPVVPLFGDGPPALDSAWHTTWEEDQAEHDEYDAEYDRDAALDDGWDDCSSIEREIAEDNLLKKLRTRQLSEKEARAVVAERSLDGEQIDAIIVAFRSRGYLDDGRLAEQLVHSGVDRKGQGRRAIAMTMTQRGIPRGVADAALNALPDDDAERALEYARHKVATMRGLDRQVALRRLVGQLARRGYPGALDAARRALDEQEASGR
jgi:regulatory protein